MEKQSFLFTDVSMWNFNSQESLQPAQLFFVINILFLCDLFIEKL
jgi:hypothetical protein